VETHSRKVRRIQSRASADGHVHGGMAELTGWGRREVKRAPKRAVLFLTDARADELMGKHYQ